MSSTGASHPPAAARAAGIPFGELYSQYRSMVRGVIFRLAGAEELDDVVQEAFVRIWRALPRFRGEAGLKTWVYRVAVNTARDHNRRRRRSLWRKFRPVTADVPSPGETSPPGDNRERVERALTRLDEKHRTVIVLHYFEELSVEEISLILGTPAGTVKSRLHHGRQRIMEILEREGVKL